MLDKRDFIRDPSVANPDIQLQGVQYERDPEAAYGQHIRNTTAICNTSASHTYGNVISVIEKYLLDQFPPDLFKTVTIATALASRQMVHLPNRLIKRELPIMVLSPRIVFGQEDNRFLGNTLLNSRLNNTQSFYGEGSLIPLASDPKRNIWIHGHFNRALLYIDVVLTFNQFNEQINWMSYIHNMIPVAHNQFVRSPLELYIPNQFCHMLGSLSHIPVDDNGSVYNFLTYMNTIWEHPITYKLKGGSNSHEFFMYYVTDIDTVIQDVQSGQGVKNGQVRQAYDISFTIRCEFNTIGYFTLNCPDMKKPVSISVPDTPDIVPIFSDAIDLDDFKLPVGWVILGWPIFKLQYGENRVSIDSILNDSLRTVIDYHLRMGIPMEKFIKIQFRENGEILSNESFYIDWANRELVLGQPNHRRTYRLIISVSPEYVNNMTKELYNLE